MYRYANMNYGVPCGVVYVGAPEGGGGGEGHSNGADGSQGNTW